ncbi:MAG: phosphatase PAP2 family protein, partial [Cytophagales bacterium]|nr:phosphatase PAP2 family protein [Cytophagales bacterium]
MTGFEWIAWLEQWDRSAFIFINGAHQPWLDPWMIFASDKNSWIPLYVIVIGYIFYNFKWKGIIITVLLVMSVVASDQFSSGLLKPTVKRLRPCHDPILSHLVYLPNNYCGGQFGFVSSHAANHFAIATFL